MKAFFLEIVTPDRSQPARPVTGLNVPAHDGRMTVLAGHQPCVCRVAAGRADIRETDEYREAWMVGPGFLVVGPERVTLLVRSAREASGPATP